MARLWTRLRTKVPTAATAAEPAPARAPSPAPPARLSLGGGMVMSITPIFSDGSTLALIDDPVYEVATDGTGRGLLRLVDRPMGYVPDHCISPMVRAYFTWDEWPRLSPYFQRFDTGIYVEAQPYELLVARYPDEEPLYDRGALWCMCYGPNCIEGEEGHQDMRLLQPLSPERWQEAKAAGWRDDDL